MNPRVSIVLIGTLLVLACSGSSDGDVVAAGGGSSTLEATFTPDSPSPPAGSAAMAPGAAAAGDTVIVEINVTGTDGVFSASLDVTFDPAVLEFLGHGPGDLFETLSGQAPIYLAAAQPGAVVIGVTSTSGAVDVSGSLTLIRLTFRAHTEGSSVLAFDNMALNDSQVSEIPGISWSGGTVDAQQP